VKRTLRHPIRGDRLHPKPSSRQSRQSSKSSWNRGARQPRMRPRKSVNVAALVGSPEDEPSRRTGAPRRRGFSRLVGAVAAEHEAAAPIPKREARPVQPGPVDHDRARRD